MGLLNARVMQRNFVHGNKNFIKNPNKIKQPNLPVIISIQETVVKCSELLEKGRNRLASWTSRLQLDPLSPGLCKNISSTDYTQFISISISIQLKSPISVWSSGTFWYHFFHIFAHSSLNSCPICFYSFSWSLHSSCISFSFPSPSPEGNSRSTQEQQLISDFTWTCLSLKHFCVSKKDSFREGLSHFFPTTVGHAIMNCKRGCGMLNLRKISSSKINKHPLSFFFSPLCACVCLWVFRFRIFSKVLPKKYFRLLFLLIT